MRYQLLQAILISFEFNRPAIQFAILRDIISNFAFAPSTQELPLTPPPNHLAKPHLIIKISPRSSAHIPPPLQTIFLPSKPMNYWHFLSVSKPGSDLRSLGFPSIACINSALAITYLVSTRTPRPQSSSRAVLQTGTHLPRGLSLQTQSLFTRYIALTTPRARQSLFVVIENQPCAPYCWILNIWNSSTSTHFTSHSHR